MPPAARTLFEKRVLDSQKRLYRQKFSGGSGGGFLIGSPRRGAPARRRQLKKTLLFGIV